MALREYLAAFANLLYPMHCFGCQKSLHDGESQYLCKGCWEGIGYIAGPRCPRCGTGLGVYAAAATKGCMECRSQNFRFDSAFCVTYYEGVVKNLYINSNMGGRNSLRNPWPTFLSSMLKKSTCIRIRLIWWLLYLYMGGRRRSGVLTRRSFWDGTWVGLLG